MATRPSGVRERAKEHGEADITQHLDTWRADDDIADRHRDERAGSNGGAELAKAKRFLELRLHRTGVPGSLVNASVHLQASYDNLRAPLGVCPAFS